MAVIQSGAATTDLATVSPTFKALRTEPRPLEHGTRGHYHMARRALVGPATHSATAVMFDLRWADATRFLVLTRLQVKLITTVIMTANQEISMAAFVARGYTGNPGTATDMSPGAAANGNKARVTHATSLLTANSVFIVNGATAVTAGATAATDANPFVAGSMISQDPNVAAATQQIISAQPMLLDWEADVGHGEHPIVLAQNEGIRILNQVAFATSSGVYAMALRMSWAEVDAY